MLCRDFLASSHIRCMFAGASRQPWQRYIQATSLRISQAFSLLLAHNPLILHYCCVLNGQYLRPIDPDVTTLPAKKRSVKPSISRSEEHRVGKEGDNTVKQ